MRTKLGETSRRLLEELADPDATAEDLARVIAGNQYVEQALLAEIRAQGLRERTPGLAAAIALFGMSRTRNFVCALQLTRRVIGAYPKTGAGGRLELKASELVKFGLKAEESARERRLLELELAFSAGLLFDLLIAVARADFGKPAGFEEYAAEVFARGLRAAAIGLELAKKTKLTSHSKYVFAACLLNEVGRLVMELLAPATGGATPSYASFRAAVAKHPVSPFVARFASRSLFGAAHEDFGGLLLKTSGLAKVLPIDRALLFQGEPYLIKDTNKDLSRFSELVTTAAET